MARLPVIIEINSHSIRLVEFKSGISGKSFVSFNKLEIEKEENFINEAIDFLKEQYPDNSGVYLSCPPGFEFSRELKLPFLEKKKVKDVIPFELESQLPYEVNEYTYDIIQWHDIENRETHVNAIGLLKKGVLPWLTALKENQVYVRGIYSTQDARLQTFIACGQKDGLFITHFEENIGVMVIDMGRPRIFRLLPFGYADLVKTISENWKKDYNEVVLAFSNLSGILENDTDSIDYDFIKKHYDLPKSKINFLMKEISIYKERLKNELNLTFNSIGLSLNEYKDKIYFLQDSHLSLFSSLILDSLPSGTVVELNAESTIFSGIPIEYYLCAGGGLSQSNSRGIQLLRDDLKKLVTERKRNFRPWLLATIFTGIVLFILGFWFSYKDKKTDLQMARNAQERVFLQFFSRKPDPDRNPANEAMGIVKKERKKTEIFRKFFSTPRLSYLLVKINEVVRNETTFEVDSISWNSSKLQLRSSIESFSDLARIKENLVNTKVFAEVNSIGEKAMPGARGKNRIKFTLSLTPETEEP